VSAVVLAGCVLLPHAVSIMPATAMMLKIDIFFMMICY
jgi:hypothetical protein